MTITATRGVVAEALGRALEAAGKRALAEAGQPGPDRLRQEAAALQAEADGAVPDIKRRVDEVRRLGVAYRNASSG